MPTNMNPEAADDLSLPVVLFDGFEPVDPRPDVWAAIVGEITQDGAPGAHRIGAPSAIRRWAPRLVPVAAVMALILGIAGFLAASDRPAVTATRELVDPHSASTVVRVETYGSGESVVTGSELPALPNGRTYQLWAVMGDEVVSVGLLGQDAAGAEFRVEGDPEVLALTVEIAGGVAVSHQEPVAVWSA